MRRINKVIGLTIAVFLGIVLTGCGKKTQEAIEKRKMYDIVYGYDDDLIKGAVVEKKSVQQLADEIMRSKVGLVDDKSGYAPYGTDENNGIFIDSGISDGDGIPKMMPLVQEDIDKINDMGADSYFEEKKQVAYAEVLKQREESMKANIGSNLTPEERLEEDLKERVQEQNKELKESKRTTSSSKE